MNDKTMLTVQWGGEIVGHLVPHRKGRVKFSYDPKWIKKQNRPVSISLSCADEEFDAQKRTAFLDNLLPKEAM